MNPVSRSEILERVDHVIPVGPPPVDDLVLRGRARRRRHRLQAWGAASLTTCAVVAAIVAAIQQGSWKRHDSEPAASDSQTQPVPWAGLTPGPVPAAGSKPPFVGKTVKVELEAVDAATPGDSYGFIIRLENAGAETVSLDPCPAYRMQYMKVVESGYLNCDAAPARLLPKESVTFEMQIPVRDFGVEGTYSLIWQLGSEESLGAGAEALVPLGTPKG